MNKTEQVDYLARAVDSAQYLCDLEEMGNSNEISEAAPFAISEALIAIGYELRKLNERLEQWSYRDALFVRTMKED